MGQSRECKASETSSGFIKNTKASKHASYPRCSGHTARSSRNPGSAGASLGQPGRKARLALPTPRPPSSHPHSEEAQFKGLNPQSPGPGRPSSDAPDADVLIAGGRRCLRLLGARRVQPGRAGPEQGAVGGAAPAAALPALLILLILQVAVQGRRELLLPPRRLHKGRGTVGRSAGQGFFVGGDGTGVPGAARGEEETQQCTHRQHPTPSWSIPAPSWSIPVPFNWSIPTSRQPHCLEHP